MTRIGIQLDEARSVAKQYGNYAGEVEQLIKSLRASQGQLNANWEGEGFQSFEERFQELMPDVEAFKELLEDIKAFLNSAVMHMEEADQAIANAARR